MIITLGEKGALIAQGEQSRFVPAFKVKVVDTPGAGDAFTAGMAFGVVHGASLADAARFGCLVAARAVTMRESVPSFGTLAEIHSFAKQNGFEVPDCSRFLIVSGSFTRPSGGKT